jgi:alpha-N-arabinofuranosidase
MSFEATVHIHPEQVIGPVDRDLFGANLEHFGESIYGGIWTEMLRSPKFSGPDPRLFEMAVETGHNPNHGIVVPWEAINPDHQRVIFEHDRTVFYSGQQSQRITVRENDDKIHGIRQRGLFIQAGRGYRLRLVLRGLGQPVSIGFGDQIWQISSVGNDWQTYTTELTPLRDNPDGELMISFEGTHSLWVGAASLMPVDEPDGFRSDLIEALQAWRPTNLRWPGGNFASAYHWQDGIGDPDLRPAYFDPAFKLWESNLVGTDEFVAFCRRVGTEPMLTVNLGDGTPEEAAAWVEYCNGSPDSPFGAQRASNGHTEPYGLKTWYVGNEQFGNWQVGHSDPETYAYRYLRFAEAMRAVDPDLKLIAVGVPGDQYSHWNERLLGIAGHEIDVLSLHYYSIRTWRLETPPSPEALIVPKLAAGYDAARVLDETLRVVRQFSDPPVPVAFDEWNTNTRGTPPLWIEDYNLADALYTAGVMHACLRNSDLVPISAIYNLVNAMGSYRVSPSGVWKTPPTLVIELLSQHCLPESITCTVDAPSFASPAVFTQVAYDQIPLLDAIATRDPDSGQLALSICNLSVDQAAQVQLQGVQPDAVGQMHLLTHDDALIENTEARPDAISVLSEPIQLASGRFDMPPLSYAMIQIEETS